MPTETVDIRDAQAHFMELLERVRGGVHVILSQDQKPVAHLTPVEGRIAGLHEGMVWTSDDFDAPVDEETWTEEK